ncbi:MAG: hypothetical protein U0R44_03385 [Candidatus Micrarchaeia archaeon]
MAKNPKPTASTIVDIVIPPKGSFFKKAPPANAEIPKTEKVSRSKVIEELRGLGRGWTEDIAALLGLPQELYRSSGEGTIYFSKEREFGIGETALGLSSGRLRAPKTQYGIAIHDRAGSVYIILVDMQRRIIVRERLFCMHDQPPEKDWGAVKTAILSAGALMTDAERGKGSIAVFDGSARLLPPETG